MSSHSVGRASKWCLEGTNMGDYTKGFLVGGLEHDVLHEFYDFPFNWEWNNHPN